MMASAKGLSSKQGQNGWQTVGKSGKSVEATTGTSARQDGGPKKRQRRSTGGASNTLDNSQTSQSDQINLSREAFKSLSIDDKLESIFVCLQSVQLKGERRMNSIEKDVHDLHASLGETNTHVKTLQYKSLDLESRQRRNNLIFRGLPESLNEDCLAVIKSFLCNELELDAENIYIHRAHRLGKPRLSRKPLSRVVNSSANSHRPVIAAFRDYQDTMLILDNASKLKGKPYGINKDFPPEIVKARKPLFQRLKEEKSKQAGLNGYIAFPTKLIINGRVIMDAFPDWREIMRQSRDVSLPEPRKWPLIESIAEDPSSSASVTDDEDSMEFFEDTDPGASNAPSSVPAEADETNSGPGQTRDKPSSTNQT